MSGLYPEYGIKMTEIKVAEINAPLKLTRIFTIRVNFMEVDVDIAT